MHIFKLHVLVKCINCLDCMELFLATSCLPDQAREFLMLLKRHFTVVAELPGLWLEALEARLPVSLF